MDCKHIGKLCLFPLVNQSILNPREWNCNIMDCVTTESVWACLSCTNAACGRYIAEHALKHFTKTSHPLAIEVNDLFVFCYICDDYVLNDNAAGELKLIRSLIKSLQNQSFAICETRSGRVLRSVQPTRSEIKGLKEKIKNEDIFLNAVWQRRTSLKERYYHIWKECTSFQKHKRKLEKTTQNVPSPLSSPNSSRLAELLMSKKRKSGTLSKFSSNEDNSNVLEIDKATVARFDKCDLLEPPKKKTKMALTPGVLGLRNLGNTCYLNSILQVLGHLLPFTEFFLRLNISGFSSPPPSPSPLNKYDSLELRNPLLDALRDNSIDREEAFVSYRDTEVRKRRVKRLSTSECYQRISRKTCNGLEGGGSSSTSHSQPATPRNSLGVPDSTDISENSSEFDDENSDVMLAEELHALLRVMWAGKHHLVAPFGLLHSVWKTIPFLRGHAQQDAQEFLQVFLDRIERELIGHSPTSKHLFDRLFYGEIVSQVSCLKCNTENKVRERFSDLALEFPERFQNSRCSKLDSCSVHEMLAQFTNTESLGRVYSCEFCKSNQRLRRKQILTDAEKRLAFTKLPLVLTVYFKRFRWFGRTGREKINTHVNFPFELDLSDYISVEHKESCQYELQAIVRHHGSGFTSGHYTAYCWNYTTQFWMHFNDAKTERCNEDDIRHTQAYILFYVKKNLDFNKLGTKILNIVENSN